MARAELARRAIIALYLRLELFIKINVEVTT